MKIKFYSEVAKTNLDTSMMLSVIFLGIIQDLC